MNASCNNWQEARKEYEAFVHQLTLVDGETSEQDKINLLRLSSQLKKVEQDILRYKAPSINGRT